MRIASHVKRLITRLGAYIIRLCPPMQHYERGLLVLRRVSSTTALRTVECRSTEINDIDVHISLCVAVCRPPLFPVCLRYSLLSNSNNKISVPFASIRPPDTCNE